MLEIALCDDSWADRDNILSYLHTYSENCNEEFSIIEFDNGELLLKEFSNYHFDLVFLDIYMKGESGIEIAHKIRAFNETCSIVFITGSPDYAIESYHVNALFYLLKPISYENLSVVMDKFYKSYTSSNDYLEFYSSRILIRVYLRDILYFEVYGHKSMIHLKDRVYSTNRSLSELEKELDNQTFLRCHRCFIVNMHYIVQVGDNYFLLTDNTQILISVRDKLKIKQQFADFCFRKISNS